jgi:hypothetical protein
MSDPQEKTSILQILHHSRYEQDNSPNDHSG